MTLTRFSFDKFCTVVTKAEELPWELEDIFGRKTAEDWDNESLKALVNAGKKGMIYFWSPKFVYSVYDLPRMEKLAKKFGYEFTAVVDPRATKEEIEGALEVMRKKSHSKVDRDVASKKSFLRSTSMDLYMRSGFNHFPVTYIYNNKNIHPRWITGIMKDNGVKVMADTFAGELK